MLRIGFSTYIVTNKRNGTLYTGHTDDLALRASQHRDGSLPGFSRDYQTKHLVWFETHESREDAFQRERRIKKWSRAWKLSLIEKLNPHWIDIGLSPVWPLPDPKGFPDLYERCLSFALER